MGGNGPQPTLELCGAIGSETIIARGAPHLRGASFSSETLCSAQPHCPLIAHLQCEFFSWRACIDALGMGENSYAATKAARWLRSVSAFDRDQTVAVEQTVVSGSCLCETPSTVPRVLHIVQGGASDRSSGRGARGADRMPINSARRRATQQGTFSLQTKVPQPKTKLLS